MKDTNFIPKFLAGAALLLAAYFIDTPPAWAVFDAPNDDTSIVNGAIYASLATSTAQGDLVYLGGNFSLLGPNTGGGAMIDRDSGSSAGLVFPKSNDGVYAVIKDGSGGWYISGGFTDLGGVSRNRIAHVLPDGSVDAAWNPNADGLVHTLALSSDGATIYAGGDFLNIGGLARNRIAALNASDGSASSTWNPNANNTVRKIIISPDGATLYAAGDFTALGAVTRNRLAAVNAASGSLTSWNPNSDNSVRALAVTSDGATIYAGGDFLNIAGAARNRLAALNTATSTATSWDPNSNGIVRAVALDSTAATVYAGGDFTTVGGFTRNRIAAVNTSDGTVTSWDPNADNSVYTLTLDPGDALVYAGGDFTNIGGSARNRLAAIDPSTAAASGWDPSADGIVRTILYDDFIIYAGGDLTSIGAASESKSLAVIYGSDGTAFGWPAPKVLKAGAAGTVYALSVSADGQTIYFGGDFDTVGATSRANIAAIRLDNTNGEPTAWNPNPNATGTVRALYLSGDGNTVYAGGEFTTIGGAARNRLAALNASDGLATAWNPNANNTVYALASHSATTTLYAGGDFTTIGGAARNRLAGLNTATSTAIAWNPNADNTVFSLIFNSATTTIFAGGSFTKIYGLARNRIAAINSATSTIQAWNPNADNIVRALDLTPDLNTVYAVGDFTKVYGLARNRLAAINTASSTLAAWNPNSNNSVRTLARTKDGRTLYAGGDFKNIGGKIKNKLAQFDSPYVQFTLKESHGDESATPAQIEVSLVDANLALTTNTVTTTVDFADVQVGGAVGGGVDYTLPASPLVIPAGQSTATINITIVNDSASEKDEPIILALSNPQNASFLPGATLQHIYYILDNDSAPSVSFDTSVDRDYESSSTPSARLTLSSASQKDVEVQIAAGGTAGSSDYAAFAGPFLIPAGQTTLTIPLNILNDAVAESDKTIKFTLANPANAALGATSTYTYTIEDDDNTPFVKRSDGLILYGESGNTTPRSRTYDGAINSFGAEAATVAGATSTIFRVKTSPKAVEAVAGYVNTSGVLRVMCYDGTSWTNDWSVTVGGTGTTRRFDIAYETKSGDAVVLYSRNVGGANQLAYRTKSGSKGCGSGNWAAAANYNSARTTGIIQWVTLASDRRSTSNLITAIWADANADLSSIVWSGMSWGNEPSAALATALEVAAAAQDVESFDVDYESLSGDVMVAWSIAGSGATKLLKYATCTGGTSSCTWSAVTDVPTVADAGTNLDLSANPNTDEMALGAIDNGTSDLSAGYWSGSAWTGTAGLNLSTAVPAAGTKLVATGWLTSGSATRAILAVNLSATTTVNYYTLNPGGAWSALQTFSPTPALGNPQKYYDSETDPFNNARLVFTMTDTNNDLFAKRAVMDGSGSFTWTDADGGAALETTLDQATAGPASFAYWRSTTFRPKVTSVAYTVGGDGGRSGDTITLTGTSLGTAFADSRASCSGGANTGCVRFVAGGSATVAEANVISWTPTSTVFSVNSSLNSIGGASALELVYNSVQDDTPPTFYIYPTISAISSPGTNAAREYDSGDTDGLIMLSGDHFGDEGGTFGTGGAATGATASNVAHSLAKDNVYLYAVGDNDGGTWRIEKRLLSSGGLNSGFGSSGVVTGAATTKIAYDVDIDSTYMYVLGDDTTPDWRIEKRLLTTGAADSGFGQNGVVTSTAASRTPHGVAIDATYMYLVGDDATPDWRIEKRLLSTGALDSGFGTSGVVTGAASSNVAQEIAIDSTYMYVIGDDATPDWRIEKRLLSTGALDSGFGTSGVVTGAASSKTALEVAIDSTYMYIAGVNSVGEWRVEKRLLSTGALDTNFGGGGIIEVSSTGQARGIAIDSSYLYIIGEDATPDWRIEKRLLSTGALDSGFGTSGVVTGAAASKHAHAGVLDTNSIWISGDDATPDWRIEKRSKADGSLAAGPATSTVSVVNVNSPAHYVAEGSCSTAGYTDTSVCLEVNPSISDSTNTGDIVLTRAADSKTDTFTGFRVLPRIISNSPTSGAAGTAVTVSGNHFCESGTCPTAGSRSSTSDNVKFGSTQALDGDVSAWTDTSIGVLVPSGTPSGSQPTKIRSNNYDSNTSAFTVP